MKRVLVTGPAGFVGANIAWRLVNDGHDVHLLVHPQSDTWRLDGIEAEAVYHEVDLEDADRVSSLIGDVRPDWVLHAAAHGAYPFQTEVHRMIATNLVGTVNLVEAARRAGFEAFVHAGTSSEYGVKGHAPAADEVLEPNSYYAVTKASATLYCRHMARHFDLPIRVLRLYSVYGPWEEPTRLMPRLVVEGMRGRLPPMTDPATARDFVHSDDVVDAFLAAAEVGGQEPGAVYNIGTGFQTSLREVTEVARRRFGIQSEPDWGTMPDRTWDTGVWVADPASALKALEWTARHDVASGFGRMVEWLTDRPRVLQRYERTHN